MLQNSLLMMSWSRLDILSPSGAMNCSIISCGPAKRHSSKSSHICTSRVWVSQYSSRSWI